MAVLKIRDENGNIVEIVAVKGNGGEGGGGVGYEDYATKDRGGVVKVGGLGIAITPDGTLCTDYANPTDIDEKTNMAKPITPYFLDYAVRSVGDTCYASIDAIGNIETAVDTILAIQEELIGGGA